MPDTTTADPRAFLTDLGHANPDGDLCHLVTSLEGTVIHARVKDDVIRWHQDRHLGRFTPEQIASGKRRLLGLADPGRDTDLEPLRSAVQTLDDTLAHDRAATEVPGLIWDVIRAARTLVAG